MIEILNRWTGAQLYASATACDIAEAVIEAVKNKAGLRCADLGGADFRGADLGGADFRGANLSCADFDGANFRCAYLGGANLRCANLRCADLGGADLGGADFRGANLEGADFRGAKQYVLRIQGSRHEINAIDDDVRVACERHQLAWWLEHFAKVGAAEGYTEQEIAEYGAHLKHIAMLLQMRKASEQGK